MQTCHHILLENPSVQAETHAHQALFYPSEIKIDPIYIFQACSKFMSLNVRDMGQESKQMQVISGKLVLIYKQRVCNAQT